MAVIWLSQRSSSRMCTSPFSVHVTDVAERERGGDGLVGRWGDGDADHARLVAAYKIVERLYRAAFPPEEG